MCAGLTGSILGNLATWFLRIPSGSSHALIGGVVRATVAAAGSRPRRRRGSGTDVGEDLGGGPRLSEAGEDQRGRVLVRGGVEVGHGAEGQRHVEAVLVGLPGGGLDTDGGGESADDDLGDAEFLEVFCQDSWTRPHLVLSRCHMTRFITIMWRLKGVVSLPQESTANTSPPGTPWISGAATEGEGPPLLWAHPDQVLPPSVERLS